MSRELRGRVALVAGADEALGRAAALALAARGVRVVVAGSSEHALGNVVGEIVYGGGQARHVVGDVDAAAWRCEAEFGALDIAIATGAAEPLVDVAGRAMKRPGRIVLVSHAGDATALDIRTAARGLWARAITVNAVVAGADGPDGADDGADEAAEVVVFFCSSAAKRITAQVLTIGGVWAEVLK